VPAVPSCILDPVRDQFLALLPPRKVSHPLGCYRRRVPGEVVFGKLIEVLVTGCGYERAADETCSATTLRRRRDEWAAAGVIEQLRLAAIAAYDRMIGLDLANLPVDGCITKAPGGGELAGPSPVDRAKQGIKRSTISDGNGIPLGTVIAPANIHDHALLDATLHTLTAIGPLNYRPVAHLDAGYDYQPCRDVLARHELLADIAHRGRQAPLQAGTRWVIERTHAWLSAYGKLRRCTERRATIISFYTALASTLVTVRNLISSAWTHYRWPNRPTTKRIR
jgi:transposase